MRARFTGRGGVGTAACAVTLLVLVGAASCMTAAARSTVPAGDPATGVATPVGGAARAPSRKAVASPIGADGSAGEPVPVAPTKAEVTERLTRLNRSEQFLFGQENSTLWGMYSQGALVSTSKWFETTAQAGRFTSDSEALVGDHPAVLGVSLGMLAFEPTGWNRRAVIAEAIRRQFAQGGLVTMDWHAPSCNAGASVQSEALATVTANGHDVVIRPILGGSSFYAEDEYHRAIASREDVPETLKCLCQIANDLPLTAGPYQGTSGMTWLIAHAKHAAQVFREQRLSGLPIIVRPFHEHTGSWFWWGQPYWNCAALLDRPDAVSGPAAYKAMVRAFVSAIRAEPGMNNLLFAYSTDRLLGLEEGERFTVAQNKVVEPAARARDQLRERLLRELGVAGLANLSPAQRAAKLPASRATSARRAQIYVAQRRPYYIEAYAGDDVFDVLGIDLYHPLARAANQADLRLFGLQLRVLADEARSRAKPYALTEAGTYRLQLEELARKAGPRGPVLLNDKKSVDAALALLFDPLDRAALLRHFGLSASGPVVLGPAERALVVPTVAEDWFNRQLLVLAKEARVAYVLVWQTYFDGTPTGHYFNYYVPYPGHPEARNFERFYADPASCFLRDACPRGPFPPPQ